MLRRAHSIGRSKNALALLLCLMLAARARGALAQGPEPEPKPFAAIGASAQVLRDSIVHMVRAQIGTPYKHGGTTPEKGFDCSGLVRYVMAALSFDIPRTARQQAKAGLAVRRDPSQLRPGDLLTFAKTKKSVVSHVGIYVGDGMFVHASSVAGRVIETPVDRPVSPLIKAWRGARRLVPADSESAVAAAPPGR